MIELLAYDVHYIDIASNDLFHKKEVRKNGKRLFDYLNKMYVKPYGTGITEIDKLLSLKGDNLNNPPFIDFAFRGSRKRGVIPIGRARNLGIDNSKIEIHWSDGCKKNLREYKFIRLNNQGEVSPCELDLFKVTSSSP